MKKRIRSSTVNRNKGGIYNININDALNNSVDKENIIKTEKRIKRNIKSFKNIMDIDLYDINAQYHSNNINYKNIKTNEELINNNKKSIHNFNFNNILGNIDYNLFKNINSKSDYQNRNFLKKNLSLLSFERFDDFNNNNFKINYSGSSNNFFQYNKNNFLKNMFLPLNKRTDIISNYNNSYYKKNLTIDSKVNQQKMKLLKNISPLDLNYNNNNNNHINSLISFDPIYKEKNEQNRFNNNDKIIKTIKTLYNKTLTIPKFKQ